MGARRRQRGRLRIVAGKWRSRLLPVADVDGLRPTSERVRETLFNWLGPGIEGRRCLDLYAGTGALGFEALSRGAAACVFVEKAPAAYRGLVEAVRLLDAAHAEIIQADALAFLAGAAPRSFDLVFLDPPFADRALDDLCRLIAAKGVLSDAGQVYLEQPKDEALPGLPAGWTVRKSKTAGSVRYTLIDTRGD